MRRSRAGWRRAVLETWAVSLCLALFLGLLQALLMSDVWWIAPITGVAPVGLYLVLRRYVRAVAAGRFAAVLSMNLVAAAHLLLPIRQLTGSRPPGLDGALTALAAVALFAVLFTPSSDRQRSKSLR